MWGFLDQERQIFLVNVRYSGEQKGGFIRNVGNRVIKMVLVTSIDVKDKYP